MWLFKRRHAAQVDVPQSEQALADAIGRRPRTRRVSVGLDRAIDQNGFVSTFKEVFKEGHDQ